MILASLFGRREGAANLLQVFICRVRQDGEFMTSFQTVAAWDKEILDHLAE